MKLSSVEIGKTYKIKMTDRIANDGKTYPVFSIVAGVRGGYANFTYTILEANPTIKVKAVEVIDNRFVRCEIVSGYSKKSTDYVLRPYTRKDGTTNPNVNLTGQYAWIRPLKSQYGCWNKQVYVKPTMLDCG